MNINLVHGTIRNAEVHDAQQITDIYNYYINETIVTFEEEAISSGEMKNRIASITKKFPWIVYEANGEILGYAYAAEFRSRYAYRFTVESTVYLKNDQHAMGFGSMLYTELLNKLKTTNVHAVIGGISLPNAASVALHEKFGFKKVAHLQEVGYKFDQWIDVGYWQLTF